MKKQDFQFFISCNLDFSGELQKELDEMWPRLLNQSAQKNEEPLKIVEIYPEGILIEASFHLGLQINFFSKISNRVLLRLTEFTARDFPKVFQRLTALKKNPIVLDALKQGLQFSVSCSGSRLNNEKRIEEILREIFPEQNQSTQALFVRIHQDLCTVSLDTTGKNLYYRSEREEQGPASLRETLAAFCGRKLIEDLKADELKDLTLVDPMAGSGTLLLETSQLSQMSPRNEFSFLSWPQCPKLFKTELFRKNFKPLPLLFKQLFAADNDPEAVTLCQKRLAKQELLSQVKCQDLMQDSTVFEGPCLVISNPPYGERLKAEFNADELMHKIIETYRPQRIGLLLKDTQSKPLETQAKNETLKAYELISKSSFLNGGLRVSFHVFSRFS
jgi:putative N6-adenine-specific DNA methylase